jgi:hypothetical protein
MEGGKEMTAYLPYTTKNCSACGSLSERVEDWRFAGLPGQFREVPFEIYVCTNPACGHIDHYSVPAHDRRNIRPVTVGLLLGESIEEGIVFEGSSGTEQITFAFRSEVDQPIHDATFTVTVRQGLALAGGNRALSSAFVAAHGRIQNGPYVIVYQLSIEPRMLISPWIRCPLPRGRYLIDVDFASLNYQGYRTTLTVERR